MTVTVGAPYYDFFAIAFGLPIVLLMGIGPLVAWRRASLRALGRALVAGRPGSRPRGRGPAPRARRGLEPGGPDRLHVRRLRPRGDRVRVRARDAGAQGARATRAGSGAFSSLVGRNRRRYGGYVVHAAIVLLLVGAIGIGGFSTADGRRASGPGDTMRVGDYTLTYLGDDRDARPERDRAPRPDRRRARRRADSARSSRARTATSPRSRPRTRSRSAPTSAARGGPLPDRGPVHGERRLPEGDREPAREPHLARGLRLPRSARSSPCGPTRASRGGSPGASPPRTPRSRAPDGGRRARARRRRSRSRASSSSRCPSCASRSADDAPGRADPRRARADAARGGARPGPRRRSRSSSSTTARARSRTRTTGRAVEPLRREAARGAPGARSRRRAARNCRFIANQVESPGRTGRLAAGEGRLPAPRNFPQCQPPERQLWSRSPSGPLLATATGASAQTAQDRQSAIDGKISSLRTQIDYGEAEGGRALERDLLGARRDRLARGRHRLAHDPPVRARVRARRAPASASRGSRTGSSTRRGSSSS